MNSKVRRALFSIGAGILALSLLQYFLTNMLATRGEELSELLAEEKLLREEHENLLTETVMLSSLTRVHKKASELGMMTAHRYTYLTSNDLAQKPQETAIR